MGHPRDFREHVVTDLNEPAHQNSVQNLNQPGMASPMVSARQTIDPNRLGNRSSVLRGAAAHMMF